MALNFTNPSFGFDSTRRSVRFWGYDGPLEIAFFVTSDALCRLRPTDPFGEAEALAAFSAHRSRILAAAARVYAQGRKGSYEVGPGDI